MPGGLKVKPETKNNHPNQGETRVLKAELYEGYLIDSTDLRIPATLQFYFSLVVVHWAL